MTRAGEVIILLGLIEEIKRKGKFIQIESTTVAIDRRYTYIYIYIYMNRNYIELSKTKIITQG